MRAWSESKGSLADLVGADQDLLHVPIGLVLFVILAFVFRKKAHPLLRALAALTALQLVNELLDGIQWWLWTASIAWGEAVEDTGLTIGLPLLVVILEGMARSAGGRSSVAALPVPPDSRSAVTPAPTDDVAT